MPPSPVVAGQFPKGRSQRLRLWGSAVACFALASFSAIADADRNPIEQLYSSCKGAIKNAETPDRTEISIDTAVGHIACTEYLDGLMDGVVIGGALKLNPVCLPKGIEHQRMARVVVKYIDDYPEVIAKEKAAVALMALVDAYPCPPAE